MISFTCVLSATRKNDFILRQFIPLEFPYSLQVLAVCVCFTETAVLFGEAFGYSQC